MLFAPITPLTRSYAEESAPLAVKASPLASFDLLGTGEIFGKLAWRGGLQLSSDDKRFGGLSSLELTSDGTGLLAVSDRGYWFRATLTYNDGNLSGLLDPELAPLLDKNGKPFVGKARNDAEALAGWVPGKIDGKVIVGFETRVKVGLYDLAKRGLKAHFEPIAFPPEIAKGPSNAELEAIGRFDSGPLKGRILVISERNLDDAGNIRAWAFGAGKPLAFSIKRYGDYAITDLAILPDNSVITVERSFGTSILPGMAIRRFPAAAIGAGATIAPDLIFEGRAPFYAIDNMEGIAVSHTETGETRITFVSDDNYRRDVQRTLLLQFALVE